jgi:tRNA dimethylallyltransferase
VVVNADSLQVYSELRILTARPGDDLLALAPHKLYGVLPAREAGSAAWWREQALAEIGAAHRSGRRVIVTGGAGLYLSALMQGLSPVPPADAEARARATALYDAIGGEAFRRRLADHDPVAAARLKPGDRQRLIRAHEVWEATGTALTQWRGLPRQRGHDLRFRLIGLAPPRPELYARIDRRFDAMLEGGALAEAAAFEGLGLAPALPANKALGLSQLRRHLAGEIDLAQAADLARQASRNYAKRQATWFRHQLPQPDAAPFGHICHAGSVELSESFLAEIIAFILHSG